MRIRHARLALVLIACLSAISATAQVVTARDQQAAYLLCLQRATDPLVKNSRLSVVDILAFGEAYCADEYSLYHDLIARAEKPGIGDSIYDAMLSAESKTTRMRDEAASIVAQRITTRRYPDR